MGKPILNLPTSRAEARERGTDRFFTGVPCRHGHIAARYVSTTNCVECQVEHARRNGGSKARLPKDEYLRIAQRLVERRGGVLLSTKYVSAKSKLRVRCEHGHEFRVTADSLKRCWCPSCKRDRHQKRMTAQLRPVEELREFARLEHGGDCLATSPASMPTRILWQCANSEHKPFRATISHVLHSKTWCPVCDAERRRLHPPKPQIPRAAVEDLIKKRGGEVIEVVGAGGWQGLRTRLKVHCADFHEWIVTASSLMHAGSWCPECRNRGERIARAIFEATFGTRFPKSKPDWLALTTGRKLELDGYSESLQIAFEYQGPHHFTRDDIKVTDALKREACSKHGVRLVEIEAIKRPFPSTNVLAKIAEALPKYDIREVPVLPAVDVFARELAALRQFAQQKGGDIVSTVYCGSEPHEWRCGNPDHPTWLAEPWRIKAGTWCPSCAGNRPLGIEGLRQWGLAYGLELMDADYRGAGPTYKWRCAKAGHFIRRSKGNIQQSLDKGHSACSRCAPGIEANIQARRQQADNFATATLPIIEALRKTGRTSLEAIARELNERGIPTARDAKWYASTVKNLLDRLQSLQ
jgi:hypothetical protein